MPYAIVINVPEAKKVCFIAMPFAERFQSVYHHLSDAASSLDLIPVRVRTGERQPGLNFTDDIADATRCARLVAAVCSGDEEGRANPNVMYELGWADALGKPTLILSDHPVLPADLAGRHVLRYTESDLEKPELTLRIRDGMRTLLDRMKDNPLTDPACAGVRVAHERHLMFTDPGFWDAFRTALSFAQTARDQHQLLTIATEPLLAKVAAMVRSLGDADGVTNFREGWRSFDEYYQANTWVNVYLPMEDRVGEVNTAFASMRGGSPTLRPRVEKCHSFYQALQDRLRGYPQLVAETARNVENGGLLGQTDTRVASAVFDQVQRVSKETKGIIMHGDRLVANLVEMIWRTGE